ncbi:hypothetical protein ACWD6R_07775 [Streptomyces sp. NPDC005151]
MVCAFFGLYDLTEEMAEHEDLPDRLHRWRLLILKALQARPEPAALVARARAHHRPTPTG